MGIKLIERAKRYAQMSAIDAKEGSFSYLDILNASQSAASTLLLGKEDLHEERVAFLTDPSFAYVAVQWGIWRAGGIAVPLCTFHPQPELEYVIEDSDASIVVCEPKYKELLEPIAVKYALRLLLTTDALSSAPLSSPPLNLPDISQARRAMIVYTSGTTGKPKGVVTTHEIISAQIRSLVQAWEWSADDEILCVLPLHHLHGILNVISCALWSGATCEIVPRFDADMVLDIFSEGRLTLFMAVPTIYVKLIEAWEKSTPSRRDAIAEGCRKMRLMVSGSAALRVPILERWKEITGHTLLERYGMTEIGMALTNPLHGERVAGYVGSPFPDVELRLVDEEGNEVADGTPGEIEVKGPGVFLEYWRRPKETADSLRNGWFMTGDIAQNDGGIYRILGRKSLDIIKTGGFKVSALEIEEVLHEHPDITECSVVGTEDTQWGERVSVAAVLRDGASLTLKALRTWAKERLAPYKAPSELVVVDELPRNAMGKVIKTKVQELFPKTDR